MLSRLPPDNKHASEDSMAYHHIFGPVLSRRLGVSLGVDLVTHKICSMDCVYCECGKTTQLTCERENYVPFEAVAAELDDFFAGHPDPDYITFSGSGEPSLNLSLGKVIRHIKQQKPGIKIAVLTNSGLFSDRRVRAELLEADLVVPSLDAATEQAFQKINRPCASLDIHSIIAGLAAFRSEFKGQIWLEVLILPGINDDARDLARLKKAVAAIRPDRVQLNTLDRPGTLADIRPASREELERVIRVLDYRPAEIVVKFPEPPGTGIKREDVAQAILETVHRRPCTSTDLQIILGLEQQQVDRALSRLEKEHKVTARAQERGVFYQTVKEGGQ